MGPIPLNGRPAINTPLAKKSNIPCTWAENKKLQPQICYKVVLKTFCGCKFLSLRFEPFIRFFVVVTPKQWCASDVHIAWNHYKHHHYESADWGCEWVSNHSLNGDWDVYKCVMIVTQYAMSDVRQMMREVQQMTCKVQQATLQCVSEVLTNLTWYWRHEAKYEV